MSHEKETHGTLEKEISQVTDPRMEINRTSDTEEEETSQQRQKSKRSNPKMDLNRHVSREDTQTYEKMLGVASHWGSASQHHSEMPSLTG